MPEDRGASDVAAAAFATDDSVATPPVDALDHVRGESMLAFGPRAWLDLG
ncbi:MAG: hypothetical protein QOJ08_859 [Ilumatobacteraceae bacterium]